MLELPQYIDSSMLSTYRACPKRFYYTYCANKVPVGESIHLTAGRAMAAACDAVRKEQFYPGDLPPLSPDQIAEIGMEAFVKEWGDLEVDPDHAKNFHNVFNAFEMYMREYHPKTDPVQPYRNSDGTPTSEFTFAIPLEVKHPTTKDPFIFCGRFDLLGEYYGKPVIVDEKTASRLSSPQKWELRGQFLGYCWACQVHGYKVNDVIIREIALQKTQIQIAPIPVSYPQFLIDRWVKQTHLTLSHIIFSYEHNVWDYNFSDSCASFNGCAYSDVCLTKDQDSFLATFADRTWTPLQHVSDF